MRAELDRRGAPARRARRDRRGRGCCSTRAGPTRSPPRARRSARRPRWPGPPATTPSWRATRPPAPPGCPQLAWRTAREALASGPVLVQVPRRGYLPSLACARCRDAGPLHHCAGPLELTSGHAVAVLPVVRAPGRRLRLPRVRSHPLPRAGRRRRADGRGARAGPSRGCRVRDLGPRRGARHASAPSRRSSSRRRAPSRSPTAATPRRCCSTAGRCSTAPTCGPARRRCAAGSPPRRSSARRRGRPGRGHGRRGPPRRSRRCVRWDPSGAADRELGRPSRARLPAREPAWPRSAVQRSESPSCST